MSKSLPVIYKDRRFIIYETTYVYENTDLQQSQYTHYRIMRKRKGSFINNYQIDGLPKERGTWWEYLGDAVNGLDIPISFELKSNWHKLSNEVQGIITMLVEF